MENTKHEWFRMRQSTARGIMVYLTVLTIGSGIFLFLILLPELNPFRRLSLFSFSLIGAILSGTLGAGIHYSRKLYKACIGLDMKVPDTGMEDQIRQMGISFYYILRPLYAACLSILTCIATKSGAEFITHTSETQDANNLNGNFPYLIMIICFFVGYSSGDLIDSLEERGKRVVEGIFRSDK